MSNTERQSLLPSLKLTKKQHNKKVPIRDFEAVRAICSDNIDRPAF